VLRSPDSSCWLRWGWKVLGPFRQDLASLRGRQLGFGLGCLVPERHPAVLRRDRSPARGGGERDRETSECFGCKSIGDSECFILDSILMTFP